MNELTSMIFFNQVSFDFAGIVKSIQFVVSLKLVESFEFKLFELFSGFGGGLCLTAGQVQGALEYGL
jgi:hypothetical protein